MTRVKGVYGRVDGGNEGKKNGENGKGCGNAHLPVVGRKDRVWRMLCVMRGKWAVLLERKARPLDRCF